MGLPGSGKTTLANEIAPLLNAKRLNADEVRKEANDWDFSEEGRIRQAKRMADFAKKLKDDGNYINGKVGDDLTIEQGYEAARLTGINQLSVLKSTLGDLRRVKRIVKVLGMVNSTSEFTDHPKVINGYSDLMVEVFGQRGKHARAAVGMGSLPSNIAVEIEMIVEVE